MKRLALRLLLITSSLVLGAYSLSGCSHHPVHEEISSVLPPIDDDSYQDLIANNTHGDKQYSGFYNKFVVSITILNSQVKTATLQRLGHYKQWDINKARSEREKSFQEMSSEAQFFVSFYSPNKDHNELELGASIWKIYLDYNGTRYPGKFSKDSSKTSQLKVLYPHHTGFNTGYTATFKVPMSAIESGQAKITLTSSLGTSEFEY